MRPGSRLGRSASGGGVACAAGGGVARPSAAAGACPCAEEEVSEKMDGGVPGGARDTISERRRSAVRAISSCESIF